MKNRRKIREFLILALSLISINGFSQLWSKMEFNLPMEKFSLAGYVEDRLTGEWDQKTCIIGTTIQSNTILQGAVGVSYWSHYKVKQEIRPIQSVSYKGLWVMLEERFFSNSDFKTRIRIRIQDKHSFTKRILVKASNEIFFQQGYEHNRLQFIGSLKIDNCMTLESGYMLYRGKENYNVLILSMIWKLQ